MKSSFEANLVDQLLTRLNVFKFAPFFLLLILCSKFYYLLGTESFLTPLAPWYLILIRDILVLSFLIIYGFSVRHLFKELKFFWWLWVFGLFLSLCHLWFEKSLMDWGQHYFRNVLIPMLFFPVFYGLLRKKVNLRLNWVFNWVFWLSIAASYLQILITGKLHRPTGLFGDAILASFFLLLGWFSIVNSGKFKQIFFSFSLVIPILYLGSSISALLSFFLGIGFFILVFRSQILFLLKKFWSLALVVFLCGVMISALTTYFVKAEGKGFEGVSAKLTYMYQAAFCVGPCWQNWSYRGRILSNQRPFEFCQDNISGCLFGNFNASRYERIESTWASLLVNWGSFFCIGFFLWLTFSFRHFKSVMQNGFTEENRLFVLVYLTCLFFLVFNVIVYRFPLNIVFYLALAYFAFSNRTQPGNLKN